jgi:hypothetical protein
MKSLIVFAGIFIMLTSCNADSGGVPPVISLNGSNEVSVSLQGTYTELGATANDQQDGDLTSNILITGTVNTQYADLYRVYYDVVDSDGNKANQVTRYVKVKNDAAYLDGYYDVNYLATPASGDGFRIDELVSSKTVNNKVYINGENLGLHFFTNGSLISLFKDNVSVGSGFLISPNNFMLNYGISGYTYQDNYLKQ